MRLSEARVGQDFEIVAVRIPREVGRRLADMGFTEGARGRIVRGGAFRGPLHIRIRDYDVLLWRCEAAGIEVLPLYIEPAGVSEIPVQGASFRGRHRNGAGGRWRPGHRGWRLGGACRDSGVSSRPEGGV